jgi:phage anti-repressor protein
VVPEEYNYGFEEAPDYVRVDVIDTSRTGRCTVDTVVKALRSVA